MKLVLTNYLSTAEETEAASEVLLDASTQTVWWSWGAIIAFTLQNFKCINNFIRLIFYIYFLNSAVSAVLYIIWKKQGPRVWRKGGEAHSPSCLKSSVKFLQSVMIWGAISSAGISPLCFLKTNVTAPVTKTFWSTSCFLLLTSFLKMLISFSSRIWHLPTLPKAPKVDHGVGVLE